VAIGRAVNLHIPVSRRGHATSPSPGGDA
jgi:hypothetical protein